MSNPIEQFNSEVRDRISGFETDMEFREISKKWIEASMKRKYVYNFSWLGRPIIQYPQDILAIQEIIWEIKPDLIIETGIAHGGSLILSASMLELLGGNGIVLGIDIDIRQYNRIEIERHFLSKRIKMIEGSSIDDQIVNQVKEIAEGRNKILVMLDSNHTHEHVSSELALYSKLVSKGSYLIVYDTIVEDLPKDYFENRPWNVGNSPKTAVHEFLKKENDFEIDMNIQNKLVVTAAPDGYLKRFK